MSYLVDEYGNPISQTNPLPTQLTGRIPEYSWFDGGTEPTPTEDFAWGYKFNTATGAVTAYGWSGTAWVEVV